LIGLVSFALGLFWAVAFYGRNHGLPSIDQIDIAVRLGAKALLVTAILAPIAASLMGSGDPATLLKDRP
jgi:hypothetical protein